MACRKHPLPYLPSPLRIVNIARKRQYMPRYHIPTSRRQPCRDAKSCVSRAMNTFIICIFLSMKIGLTLRLTRRSAQPIPATITPQPYHFSLVRRKILRLYFMPTARQDTRQYPPQTAIPQHTIILPDIRNLFFLPPQTALFQSCGARTRSF